MERKEFIALRAKANAEKTPGSDAARKKGCTCAVYDNAHGIGYMGVWGTWCMSGDCPLHGKKP